MPNQSDLPSGRADTGALAASDRQSGQAARPAPPMQVITKGWWKLRYEQASVADLRKEDRLQAERRMGAEPKAAAG